MKFINEIQFSRLCRWFRHFCRYIFVIFDSFLTHFGYIFPLFWAPFDVFFFTFLRRYDRNVSLSSFVCVVSWAFCCVFSSQFRSISLIFAQIRISAFFVGGFSPPDFCVFREVFMALFSSFLALFWTAQSGRSLPRCAFLFCFQSIIGGNATKMEFFESMIVIFSGISTNNCYQICGIV